VPISCQPGRRPHFCDSSCSLVSNRISVLGAPEAAPDILGRAQTGLDPQRGGQAGPSPSKAGRFPQQQGETSVGLWATRNRFELVSRCAKCATSSGQGLSHADNDFMGLNPYATAFC